MESNKEKNENSESQINIPGLIGYVDFDKCTNLFNFNSYLSELKMINTLENLVDFHIYNPYKDKDEFFISTFNNDIKNNKLLILIYNDLSPIETKLLDYYKKENQYVLLIFDRNNSPNNIIYSISKYFYKNVDSRIEKAEKLLYKEIVDAGEKLILKSEINNIIYNSRANHIQYLYRIKKEIINLDSNAIIDKNIIPLYESLYKQGEIKNILIEEPLSIISLYLKHNFKKLNIFMLESYCEKNIRKNMRAGVKIDFSSNKNKNILEYLKDGKNKYDAIILENNRFPDEKNDIIPDREYLKQENLTIFNDHLNDKGIIYFHVLIKNKYLYNFVKEEIEKQFSIINSTTLFPLEYLLICSKKNVRSYL